MDIGRESSYEGYPVNVCWTPTTPANPDVSDPKSNCKNGSEEQLDMNAAMYNTFLIDNVWKSIPCSDLLALADAAITTKVSGGGCGGIGGGDTGLIMQFGNQDTVSSSSSFTQQWQPDGTRYLFDLNSPPIATEQEELITSISTQVTPVTPKQTIRTDEDKEKQDEMRFDVEQLQDDGWELEVNEEFEEGSSDDFNLKKTPQPKQKRRKHRPKVVTEGRPKITKKPLASSTKRKYIRKIVNETITVPKTRNTCRRKISFEEEEDLHTGVWSTGQLTGDTIHGTQTLGPITPNKSEKPEKGIKHTWSRAKRHISFSQKDARNDTDACFSNGEEERGTKREFESLEAYLHFPESYKKKRTTKCRSSITSRAISSIWFPKNDSFSFQALRFKARERSTVYKHMWGFGHVGSVRKKRSKGVKRMRDLASFGGIWLNHKRALTCMEALSADFGVNISTKKRTKRNSIVSSSYHNHYFLTNHLGFHPGFGWKTTYDINSLINQFKNLDINNRRVEKDGHALVPYLTRFKEKNGIVLYQQDRSVVPFEDDYNPLKRRIPRPKVDLDEETSRVWRLLLEDINSEGIDGIDDDKTKWWEDERNVFKGRAVSFIARMHLVQGDRRFSCWKGSVVDSVTGVFLTQNVSDHASSSAFMSLAAKYPLKSKSIHEPFEDDKSIKPIKESCDFDIEESITWHEENPDQKLAQDLNSMTLKNSDSYEEKEVVHSNEYIDQNSFHDHHSGSEQSEISTESTTQETQNLNLNIIFNQETQENNFDVQKAISEVTENNNIGESSRGLNEDGKLVTKKGKTGKEKKIKIDWDSLRIKAEINHKRERTPNNMDSLDYEALRLADVNEIADTIKDRGMNNMLAERIKDFLNRLVRDHGSIDLEWLRDVPPDKAKEYLLSFRGLGLKSVECVRLLTLHHLAFPVDTNVGRIAVRLGWVPLQPLPESLQLHLLELYPVLESIQKYLWPRLYKLDQRTLYELHYQMITFGKVFCTKNKPNCNACPMRGECRHFASAFASARLSLPAPEETRIVTATENKPPTGIITDHHHHLPPDSDIQNHHPIIEEPTTPEPEKMEEFDMEDFCEEEEEDSEEIPTIRLNMEEFTQNLQTYMENNMELEEGDMSRALVSLTSEAASIPTPKLKNVSQLRTEHQVYELPDSHPLLEGLDKREPDDPCSYLLAIWTPGETAESIQPPGGQCSSQESGNLCHKETCFSCNSIREANSQTVRGTLLIPCRTAMRGSFPLNGTYFQVNEVFADHDSSLNPIDVPRSWLWNLPRRTVYFGTSIPTIFKGLTTEGIQYCFWRGFVCVRGFDQKTRAPRPLMARLHFPASKLKRSRGRNDEN
ncbi:unnamed protein product [Lactuca saligna]|uniref:HhH-GPD domain-containing protein n=1 Tax=Lactuca saligna TaxID=75948 RepID=A0AA35V0D0_LACSI|nr:unnamed protein product [Lactuca saligna]